MTFFFKKDTLHKSNWHRALILLGVALNIRMRNTSVRRIQFAGYDIKKTDRFSLNRLYIRLPSRKKNVELNKAQNDYISLSVFGTPVPCAHAHDKERLGSLFGRGLLTRVERTPSIPADRKGIPW